MVFCYSNATGISKWTTLKIKNKIVNVLEDNQRIYPDGLGYKKYSLEKTPKT